MIRAIGTIRSATGLTGQRPWQAPIVMAAPLRIISVNKVSSPSLWVVSTVIVVFAASVMLYLAVSGERNPHTAPSASSPPQSTGSR
jgi:hypothetical protein